MLPHWNKNTVHAINVFSPKRAFFSTDYVNWYKDTRSKTEYDVLRHQYCKKRDHEMYLKPDAVRDQPIRLQFIAMNVIRKAIKDNNCLNVHKFAPSIIKKKYKKKYKKLVAKLPLPKLLRRAIRRLRMKTVCLYLPVRLRCGCFFCHRCLLDYLRRPFVHEKCPGCHTSFHYLQDSVTIFRVGSDPLPLLRPLSVKRI